MLQQLPIALILYAIGGMPWVVWGVCVRVAACTTMHWYISRVAHTTGPQSWMVDGVGTMGYDVPLFAIPTMGESWHNNHHAYPASARHGLFPGQFDPGFRFIKLLEYWGLAWDIKTPANLPARKGLRSLITAQG
jgi:sn-1 stearoyl-lipid 9-desaturase